MAEAERCGHTSPLAFLPALCSLHVYIHTGNDCVSLIQPGLLRTAMSSSTARSNTEQVPHGFTRVMHAIGFKKLYNFILCRSWGQMKTEADSQGSS
jgi:hypothetical protein